jgi:anti-sigma factor RsiW
MREEPNQEIAELMTRFLLGQLSEEERSEVEQRFLSDEEYFAQLLIMEDSLVDDFVSGRLNQEDQKHAERLFRSSAAAKKELKFTENLVANLKQRREAKEAATRKKKTAVVTRELVGRKTSPWLQWQISLNLIGAGFKGLPAAFTAAAGLIVLLLAGASIYFIVHYQRQTRELLSQRAALELTEQKVREQLSEEMQNSSELRKQLNLEAEKRAQAEETLSQLRNPAPKSIISVVLLPAIFQRAGGSKTVTLNAESKRLQLLLEVPSESRYPSYNVVIKSFDGAQIWSRNSIPATQIKQNKLSLILTSSLFPYNDYRIELHGVTEDGASPLVADYAFKVRQ